MQPASPSSTAHPWGDADTPYLEIGGESEVRNLVETFYDIVEAESPVPHAILPTNTLNSRVKLFEFLSGWLGGPPLYMEKRGHPRLRMRHFPFAIGDDEASEWMRCMEKSMDSSGIEGRLRSFLIEKLNESALHLPNQT